MAFLLLAPLLTALGITSYYAWPKDVYTKVVGLGRTFADYFSALPRTLIDFDDWFALYENPNIKATSIVFPKSFLDIYPELEHSKNPPDYEGFCRWNATQKDLGNTPNAREDVLAGASLVQRAPMYKSYWGSRAYYASIAPQGGVGIIVGAYENGDFEWLNRLSRFHHIVSIDLWDSGDQVYKVPYFRQSAARFVSDGYQSLMGDQSFVLPALVKQLKSMNLKINWISVEGATLPNIHIPTLFTAFNALEEDGVLTMNDCPHFDAQQIPLYADSGNELLLGSAHFLSIMRGNYTVIPNPTTSTSYTGIIKCTAAREPIWNSSRLWPSPFGVVLEHMIPYFVPRYGHKLQTIHYVNFFGLGTRVEKCELCSKTIEIGHRPDWETQVMIRMGSCNPTALLPDN